MNTAKIIGIGTDLIEINRIEKTYHKYGLLFLNKVFTKTEIDYCFSKKHPFSSLAARFAAKEACSKALLCGIGTTLSWKSISVDKGSQEEPILVLDTSAKQLMQRLGAKQAFLSLTHTHSLAQAFVIIQA